MHVRDVMNHAVVTLRPDQSLREAMEILRSRRIRHLPVVEDMTLVGIVTDRDVKRVTPSLHGGADQETYDRVLDETTVAQFMTREPMTVQPDAPLKAVVETFINHKMGALPVVDDHALVGIVSAIDLLRLLHRIMPE